jgi:hypothetical protein
MIRAVVVLFAMVALAFLANGARGDDIQAKLLMRYEFDIGVKASIPQAQQFLFEKIGCKVEIDFAAFEKEKLKIPDDQQLCIPKMPQVFGDTMLRLVASQIHGVYEVRDGMVRIVPEVQDGKPRSFPPFTEMQNKARRELRERVAKIQVDVEKEIDAPIKDIVEFIGDRFDVTFIFDLVELKNVGNNRAHINAGKSDFDDLMKQMLKDVNATYRIEPDHIRIVRQRES